MPFSTPATLPPPPADLLTGASLFLDFDGTLVDIAATPDAVSVDAALRAMLGRLSLALDGRIALISGRSAGEIRALIGDGVTVAGSHGLEILGADGRLDAPARPPELSGVHAAMARLAADWPGVLVEDKPLGVALHFRQCPGAEAACRTLATALAAETGLRLQPGKMVFELRAQGGDKGAALRRLLAAPAMAGRRPIFLGDDLTDEPGFAAANALGGAGVLVGAAGATTARYRLADVAAARRWLDQACRQPA